jgi:adenylosuccinate synthase
LKPKLGTTGQGIAPAYADKMLRVGKTAGSYLEKKYIWDGELNGNILCEGAQSFWLDINYGDYPYVTSSETLPYSACSLGFSPKKIRDIIGVAKIYDTKSGVDPLFPESLWNDEELSMIIETGKEFGSTTGRKRIANWLNLSKLIDAITISGVNKLIINKCDILEQINTYKAYQNNSLYKFNTLQAMQSFIKTQINHAISDDIEVTFSGNKSFI